MHGIECWLVKSQQEGNYFRENWGSSCYRKKVEFQLSLGGFEYAWTRSVGALISRLGQMNNSSIVRDKGRPRKILGHTQTIKRDLEVNR